jgi:hypothetical protein
MIQDSTSLPILPAVLLRSQITTSQGLSHLSGINSNVSLTLSPPMRSLSEQ